MQKKPDYALNFFSTESLDRYLNRGRSNIKVPINEITTLKRKIAAAPQKELACKWKRYIRIHIDRK
jgi:hypothetical protein